MDAFGGKKIEKFSDSTCVEQEDFLVNEVAVAIIYNGKPHVVVMCTPQNIEDFIYGFSLTEGIIKRYEHIISIEIKVVSLGIEVYVEIVPELVHRLDMYKRQMEARTGCGICGLDRLSSVEHPLERLENKGKEVTFEAIQSAFKKSNEMQDIGRKTGASHAAFWCDLDGNILLLREDVGRHVALDKLIGAFMRLSIDISNGFCLVTSRASYEMVQKAIIAKIPCMAAISAPTYRAVDLAVKHNLTLWGFVRKGSGNRYSS